MRHPDHPARRQTRHQPVLRKTQPGLHRACWSLALLVLASHGGAQAITFNDSFTLSTSGQGLLSSTANSWSYDSGLLGAQWGSYAGKSASGFGVNAITGSERQQMTPHIPATFSPGTPAVTERIWDPVHGWKTRTIWPAIPPVQLTPDVPATYADTRTGASAGFSSSGQVGISAKAQASGGSLSVVLPVATQLTLGSADAVTGKFHVGSVTSFGSGASISTVAPDFKAQLGGTININGSFTGSGCLVGAGCSNSTSAVKLNAGSFTVASYDTSQPDPLALGGTAVSLVNFDTEYEFHSNGMLCPKGSAYCTLGKAATPVTVASPTLVSFKVGQIDDLNGGTLVGNRLKLSATEQILTTKMDIAGVAQAMGGAQLDVINPTLSMPGVGALSGSLVQGQAGAVFSLTQTFELAANPIVALTFDKDVELKIGTETKLVRDGELCTKRNGVRYCTPKFKTVTTDVWQNVGKTVAFDLQEGADLRFDGAAGALLSREYSMGEGADFTTAFKLGIDPVVSLDAACMRIKLTVGNDTGRQCAYSDTFQTTDLVAVNVYSKQFALAGFNAVAFTTAVPEPATWWTLLAGLLAIGFANQRRAKGAKQDC